MYPISWTIRIKEEIKKVKNVRTKWEWKHNTTKPLKYNKNGPNRDIYSFFVPIQKLEKIQINYLML